MGQGPIRFIFPLFTLGMWALFGVWLANGAWTTTNWITRSRKGASCRIGKGHSVTGWNRPTGTPSRRSRSTAALAMRAGVLAATTRIEASSARNRLES